MEQARACPNTPDFRHFVAHLVQIGPFWTKCATKCAIKWSESQLGTWVVLFFALSFSVAAGGLPEPDLVIYGTIRDVSGQGSVRLTAGTLAWTFQPAGGGTPVIVSAALTNIN